MCCARITLLIERDLAELVAESGDLRPEPVHHRRWIRGLDASEPDLDPVELVGNTGKPIGQRAEAPLKPGELGRRWKIERTEGRLLYTQRPISQA